MNNNINSPLSQSNEGFVIKTTTDLEGTKESKNNTLAEKNIALTQTETVDLTEKVIETQKVTEQNKTVVSEQEINHALEIVSNFMHNSNKQVEFSKDNSSGKTVIIITDKETQEVINQFPSEKIISMAKRIQNLNMEAESISGLLIDSRV